MQCSVRISPYPANWVGAHCGARALVVNITSQWADSQEIENK